MVKKDTVLLLVRKYYKGRINDIREMLTIKKKDTIVVRLEPY